MMTAQELKADERRRREEDLAFSSTGRTKLPMVLPPMGPKPKGGPRRRGRAQHVGYLPQMPDIPALPTGQAGGAGGGAAPVATAADVVAKLNETNKKLDAVISNTGKPKPAVAVGPA